MSEWWQSLNSRERVMVASATLLVVVSTLFLTLLEPMAIERKRLESRLQAEKAVLGRIEDNAIKAQSIRARMADNPREITGKERTLLSIVNESASRNQLDKNIRRIVPTGNDKATIAFEQVPFDDLMTWLVELQKTFGVIVNRINVDKTEEQGFVRANLSLSR